jgi:hypothetical protein
MHLHGHHAVVLSRDGVRATGSPWWVDSLEVGNGESYEIAFVADNPGVWMDHCHNLPHAAEGLVAHLMYEDVTTPFAVGGRSATSRSRSGGHDRPRAWVRWGCPPVRRARGAPPLAQGQRQCRIVGKVRPGFEQQDPFRVVLRIRR